MKKLIMLTLASFVMVLAVSSTMWFWNKKSSPQAHPVDTKKPTIEATFSFEVVR